MSSPSELSIVYDGHCGFCVRALNAVTALDSRRVMRLYDAHDPETYGRFPELRGADLADAMYTIVKDELPYRGFFAFRRLAWAGPLLWLFLPLFYFPGVGSLGPVVYAWVARNRGSL